LSYDFETRAELRAHRFLFRSKKQAVIECCGDSQCEKSAIQRSRRPKKDRHEGGRLQKAARRGAAPGKGTDR
jgi:hypothetical protein